MMEITSLFYFRSIFWCDRGNFPHPQCVYKGMGQSLERSLGPIERIMDVVDCERFGDICAAMSNQVLLKSLAILNDRESRSMSAILAVLGELHKRYAVVDLGYHSLFRYCVDKLGYSEDQAGLRIRVAKAAQQYKSILRMIAQRSLSLTAVSRLSPYLTAENYLSLLGKASRRSLDDLDRLIASIAPRPEPRPVIRALSVGSNDAPVAASAQLTLACATSSDPVAQASISEKEEASPTENFDDRPQYKGRVQFSFVASEAFRAKFNRAREVMAHVARKGEPEIIFEKALDLLLEKRDPMRVIARKDREAAKRKAKKAQG